MIDFNRGDNVHGLPTKPAAIELLTTPGHVATDADLPCVALVAVYNSLACSHQVDVHAFSLQAAELNGSTISGSSNHWCGRLLCRRIVSPRTPSRTFAQISSA